MEAVLVSMSSLTQSICFQYTRFIISVYQICHMMLRSLQRLVSCSHVVNLPKNLSLGNCQLASPRTLSTVPIDDELFGLTDDQKQVVIVLSQLLFTMIFVGWRGVWLSLDLPRSYQNFLSRHHVLKQQSRSIDYQRYHKSLSKIKERWNSMYFIFQLRQSVARFCDEELRPHADEIDKSNEFPGMLKFWRKLGDMGLLGVTAPGNDLDVHWI